MMPSPRRTRLIRNVLLAFGLVCAARGEVALHPLFQDSAVLQRDQPVPVWGTAAPREKITVEFRETKAEAVADARGRWRATLPPMPATTIPTDLIVTGSEKIVRHGLVVGEVWLCSGQSNMALSVAGARNAAAEISAADFPLIRHFKVPINSLWQPAGSVGGSWEVCQPDTAGRFTAAGYFFAREIHQALGVPVGLINSSVGGTEVESWMSEEALMSDPAFAVVYQRWGEEITRFPAAYARYQNALQKAKAAAAQQPGAAFREPAPPFGFDHRNVPTGLFNGMIAPLIPYAIRGMLWYQGERNRAHPEEYRALFGAMIHDWRRRWGEDDAPFFFVQLPNYAQPGDASGDAWARVREAQEQTLAVPNTSMAVTIDIGESKNIHPKNKQEVGRRLALLALNRIYGKPGEDSGPLLDHLAREGSGVRATFFHAVGLQFRGSTAGFELAGPDKVFHPAEATIRDGALVVSSARVPRPAAIRYAWGNDPKVSLFNGVGHPAAPFFRLLP